MTGDVHLHGLLHELQQLHLGEAGSDNGLRGTLPVDQVLQDGHLGVEVG